MPEPVVDFASRLRINVSVRLVDEFLIVKTVMYRILSFCGQFSLITKVLLDSFKTLFSSILMEVKDKDFLSLGYKMDPGVRVGSHFL